MMSLHTNLQGRLRNTNLPKSHGLQPIFETVVNSIHSLEERGNLSTTGKITLRIKRDSALNIDDGHVCDVVGFSVEDNGVGFNDKNLQSFETLDSDHKIDKGCRGVGRLLWLKAFDKVEISSSFIDPKDNSMHRRKVSFDANNGIESVKQESKITENNIKTVVTLIGFDTKYRTATPKNTDSIARALLEHCLWYFVRSEDVPDIYVSDGEENIDLNELYDGYIHESAYSEKIQIKDNNFDLTHIKFRASSSKKHSLSLCAAGRLVKEEGISGKIAGLHGKITDNAGEFIYSCYVASSYLDECVRAERTSFDMLSEGSGDFFAAIDISLEDIKEGVLDRSKEYLKDYLKENLAAGRDRVDNFIAEKAPRYRPIISQIKEEELAVDPNISDKDLELHLHKQLAEVERKMLEQGHDIVSNFDGDIDNYQEKLNKYLKAAGDIKKSDLASYVSHRRVIIHLLEKSIRRTEAGGYVKEDFIHKLIMPMRMDSNEILSDSHNLWLLDERLAFHNYLASDKTLSSMPVTGDSSTKRPDLCALNVCDNPILVSETQNLPLASITVIEIKRLMRNDAGTGEDGDPIEQVLGYLNRIRDGSVTTAAGRRIPNSKNIPGYCYVVCDITETIKKRCQLSDLTITSDHLGYFGFHKQFQAYIEVISYDKLLNNAKERNRAFFDKLGLPAT